MVVKYSKWPQNIPTYKASKIYPNRDFWFENIPSGNPGEQTVRIFAFWVIVYFE
jgi:hypothetical protein